MLNKKNNIPLLTEAYVAFYDTTEISKPDKLGDKLKTMIYIARYFDIDLGDYNILESYQDIKDEHSSYSFKTFCLSCEELEITKLDFSGLKKGVSLLSDEIKAKLRAIGSNVTVNYPIQFYNDKYINGLAEYLYLSKNSKISQTDKNLASQAVISSEEIKDYKKAIKKAENESKNISI
ncbi:MAG: hypothetical protein R3Y21_04345 [Mycoplasmatota bacterium]